MMRDFKQIENELWKRFNGSRKEQRWYYEGLMESLAGISDYKMYQELKYTVEELFNSQKVIEFINNSKEGE